MGAIAQARGVATLEPIVLAILAFLLGLWLLVPKVPAEQGRGERGGDASGGERWVEKA